MKYAGESMSKAGNDDIVKVHYTGTLTNGETFDSSREREPLEFTIGKGQLLKMFEEAVIGLEVGKTITVEIPAKDGYGERQEHLAGKIPIEKLPPEIIPEIGLKLQSQTPEGQPIILTITDFTDSEVTLDANHHLAGEDLKFEIELVEII